MKYKKKINRITRILPQFEIQCALPLFRFCYPIGALRTNAINPTPPHLPHASTSLASQSLLRKGAGSRDYASTVEEYLRQ